MAKNKIIETVKLVKIYENDFIEVFDNEVLFPSGKKGTYFRTRWKAPHGVAILPVVDGKALLIENYRYAELSTSMEVPQGFGIEGNTSINDAKRELFEEIGATDVHLNYIGQTGKDYITYLFQADLPKTFMPSFSEAEDTESITSFQLYSKNTLIKSNFTELNIFDPVTQICLLKFTQ